MWGIIATWRMALTGVSEAAEGLVQGQHALDALQHAISNVESNPDYLSVGFGALPNEAGELELDSGIMDGTTLSVGAVCALRNFENPVRIARLLLSEPANNFLTGEGAARYARANGFVETNLLTEKARARWKQRRLAGEGTARPYEGHDTVGMVCLDEGGHLAAATSTSGLFMKRVGRIGDSPLCGSGFYANTTWGGATATGFGEDLYKGAISYEISRRMSEGATPQEAAEGAVGTLDRLLKERRGKAGDLSVVCLNPQGEWGAATNTRHFSFVVATAAQAPTVYVAHFNGQKTCMEKADAAWIASHTE